MHKYSYCLTFIFTLNCTLVTPTVANEMRLNIDEGAQTIDKKNAERTADINDQLTDNNIRYEFCGELGWLNDNYCYLNYGVDSTAVVINNWFKREGSDNLTPATTKGRLRFGWEPRSGDLGEFDLRFKIRVKLPALEDRAELLLSDEEDDVNQQGIKAARGRELSGGDQAVLALQFKDQTTDKISYRIGFGRGSQLYTRARFSDKYSFSEQATLRYFAETNYYSGDKLGFEANAQYGFVFDSESAFEISNSFRYRNNSNDWLWRHELKLLRLGKNDTSYLFTASIDGVSRPAYRKEQMLVSVRYKRKVLREWLFLEIEPYVLWLRDEDFRASMGLAIRTEIHFST
jgi:hypothetical protein